LQFGALIPLGIFTATVVSRLRFLGVTATGPYITLFGGFLTVFDGIVAAFTVWSMTHPDVVQNATLTTALYYLSYAFGGPGFSVPMGLLIAGVCCSRGHPEALTGVDRGIRFAAGSGGELSSLNLLFPEILFLIPLVRFPGFIWLIAAGSALPKTIARVTSSGPAAST
jgi:hypothetical protein